MRSKSRRGGRSRPSRCSVASTSDSSPSSMASPSVPDRDVPNAEDNTLNDGFVSGQDVSSAEENTLNEGSKKETHDVLDKVDGFQKDTCIRCDESGDLLVCTEIGCPIALHEYCMSCQPSFDEEGRFYCPYCSYKRALVRVNELRRKAMVAKRALSDFIDNRMVGGGNSQQVGEAGKKKVWSVSTCGVDEHLPNHESHLGNESLRDQDMQVEQNQSNEGEDHARTASDIPPVSMVEVNVENHNGPIVSNLSNGIRSTPEVQLCEDSMNEEETREADTSGTHQVESLEDKEEGKTMEEDYSMSTDNIEDEVIVKDQGQPETPSAHQDEEETAVDDVDHGAGRESQGTGDCGEQVQPDKEGMLENKDLASGNKDLKNETFVKKKRFKTKANRKVDLQNSNYPRMSLRLQNASASRNLNLKPASPNQFKNLDFHSGKRKRMRWSTEEEEMLKEGVRRFSSTANKNLPWRKILEFGRHVFDETRTPVDLKDKWRNILAK